MNQLAPSVPIKQLRPGLLSRLGKKLLNKKKETAAKTKTKKGRRPIRPAVWILYIIMLVVAGFLLFGCGSTRITASEQTDTKTIIKIDTLIIYPDHLQLNQVPADFVSDSVIIAENKNAPGGGSYRVKYYPGLNTFDIYFKPPPVHHISADTNKITTIKQREIINDKSWLEMLFTYLPEILIIILAVWIFKKK